MTISKDKVVTIDYHLTGPDGQTLDSSRGRAPLNYLHGAGNIIPGLEQALEGKQAGDALTVDVPPEQAYGQKNPQAIAKVPRDAFKGVDKIEPGMQFHANGPQGQAIVTVVEVSPTEITIDANHPLAGVPLKFEVNVVGVRDATAEELSHGHVHGPGGHEH